MSSENQSFPVQTDKYFQIVSRYMERNVLRARLVERTKQRRWGSLWRWVQAAEPVPRLLAPWPIPRLPN